MMIAAIVGMDLNNCIGLDGDLLFRIPDDLKRFKSITSGNTVIMGRKTFDSIGHALPDRRNIVISRSVKNKDSAIVVDSIDKAFSIIDSGDVFVIGGGQMYLQTLHLVDKLFVTRVMTQTIPLGKLTYFPKINRSIWQLESQGQVNKCPKTGLEYFFETYKR